MEDTIFTKEISNAIIEQLNSMSFNGTDLGDIGNEIGIAVGNKILNKNEDGYLPIAFIHGFKHGISLTDGTH